MKYNGKFCTLKKTEKLFNYVKSEFGNVTPISALGSVYLEKDDSYYHPFLDIHAIR